MQVIEALFTPGCNSQDFKKGINVSNASVHTAWMCTKTEVNKGRYSDLHVY